MDEQKKSDCMAQKKKKPASGSTGKKKNERASERASEVAHRQTNEG